MDEFCSFTGFLGPLLSLLMYYRERIEKFNIKQNDRECQ